MHRGELHGANTGTRGGDRKGGPPNKEQGDGMGDSSLQSHSGANLNPKTAKDRSNVPKGGEAGGVSLTDMLLACIVHEEEDPTSFTEALGGPNGPI
jgi:hypothetical protein